MFPINLGEDVEKMIMRMKEEMELADIRKNHKKKYIKCIEQLNETEYVCDDEFSKRTINEKTYKYGTYYLSGRLVLEIRTNYRAVLGDLDIGVIEMGRSIYYK